MQSLACKSSSVKLLNSWKSDVSARENLHKTHAVKPSKSEVQGKPFFSWVGTSYPKLNVKIDTDFNSERNA